jgi:hypothetical protein
MADRNEHREPRWNSSGYWVNREDDDQREGDRALSRTYDREDMRRYARKSQEQAERLRAMRSQERSRRRDYRHTSGSREGGDQNRWGSGHYERDRSYDRGQGYNSGTYNSEMARGRGFEGYRGMEGQSGDRERQTHLSQTTDHGYDPYDEGERYRYQDWGGYPRQQEGEFGNFWGERERWRHYGENARRRDFIQGRDFDYQIEGGWDDAELDREFDLDPGFSYEFGTDFAILDEGRRRGTSRGQRARGRETAGSRTAQGSGMRREAWDVPGEYSGVGPRGYQRSSERINEDIHRRLTYHGQIDARAIHVEVENGAVTLSGSASSKEEKYLAEQLVETISGVQEVHNHIRVKTSEVGRIHAGMQVNGMDGKYIGKVKQVRSQGFILNRENAGDTYIPNRAVKRTNGQITLHVAGNEIDRQGWREY